MKLSQLQEAKYIEGRGLINKALGAVRDLRDEGGGVFVARFDAEPTHDPDQWLNTFKELSDRFGQPKWRPISSEAKTKSPYWKIDKDVELLLHHVGLSVIVT